MSTSRRTRRHGGGVLGVFLLALAGVAQAGAPLAEGARGSAPGYANYFSEGPLSVSEDGRFVLFTSFATNLVPGDTNDGMDLFLLDNADGGFSRIDVLTDTRSSPPYADAAVSDDGRYVLFSSRFDLASGTATVHAQVYRFDRETGTYLHLSVDAQGQPGDDYSYAHDLSADGRYAVFSSDASNINGPSSSRQLYRHDAVTGERQVVIVEADGQHPAGYMEQAEITPDGRHVLFVANVQLPAGTFVGTFVRDMVNNVTTLASVANDGSSAMYGHLIGNSRFSCSNRRISADGRFVVFDSYSRAAPGDTDGEADMFVRDRFRGITHWVSDPVGSVAPLEWSRCGSISANGRTVAYVSGASQSQGGFFVRDLTNGTLTQAVSTRPWNLLEDLGVPSLSGDGTSLFHINDAAPDTVVRQLVRWRRGSGQVVLTRVRPNTDPIFASGFEQGL